MKVLQLTHKPPFPAVDGGCLAMHQLTLGHLNAGVDLKLLSLHTAKHPYRENELPEGYRTQTGIETVFAATEPTPWGALASLAKGSSYNVDRFRVPAFEQLLTKTLQQDHFDIVLLESLFTVPNLTTIRKHSTAKVVLRSHNVEFDLWEARADKASNPAKKTYLRHLARKLKRYEIDHLNRYDGLATISSEDYQRFTNLGCTIPLHLLPFSYPEVEPGPANLVSYDLVFLGALDWEPNLDGLEWFVESVWPAVRKLRPSTNLAIAGRNPGKRAEALESLNIRVLGEVPEVGPFLHSGRLVIAPVRSGSGVRIKVLEAMAHGRPVVTTPKGAQGIDYENGTDLSVADDPADMANTIHQLLDAPETTWTMGDAARQTIRKNHNPSVIMQDLLAFYQSLLAK